MATIVPHGKGFRVQIRKKGQRSLSRTFSTRKLAEAWAEQTEGANGTTGSSCSLSSALDLYEREFTPAKRGAKQERQRIRLWQRSPLSHRDMKNISTADLAKWRNDQLQNGLAPSTIRNMLTIISQVYKVGASEWGYEGLINPVAQLRLPKPRPGRDRRLEGDEETRLLKAAASLSDAPWMRALLIVLIETGMRRSELLGLLRFKQNENRGCVNERASFDLNERVAHLPITKNGRSRAVPLSSRARAAMVTLLPDFVRFAKQTKLPFGADAAAVSYRWKQVVANASVKGLTMHDLRHEAVSRLFEKGLTTEEVMSVSGHSTYTMLSRYTHLRAADLAAKLG